MGYSVITSITPHAAAKLLISNEIDISFNIPHDVSSKILDELLALSIEECLSIIDTNNYGDVADVKYIPQFGKTETLLHVPYYFTEKGQTSVDYPQLGFYLKPDLNASLMANTKFGENHGKTMSLLGLTDCVNKRIVPSAFTSAFCSCDANQQNQILLKLFFRIPIVQIILKAASVNTVNGYLPMQALMDSTRRRRSQCLRAIFKLLLAYDDNELNRRINNINWEDS